MSHHTPFQFRVRLPFVTRSALIALTIGSIGAAPTMAPAQGVDSAVAGPFELRAFAGAFVPTGRERHLLRNAFFGGGQASYRIVPALAATGTFGWSPNKDRVTPGAPSVDILQYDIGLEGRAASWWRGATWDLTPFVGAGAGGRTFTYRDFDADSQSNFTGYGALGGEFGFGRIGARFEARDYLSRFTPVAGSSTADTRNDVTLSAGLTVHF